MHRGILSTGVQLTDTHIAFILKRKRMKFKTQLMRDLRTKAMALGHNEVNFTVSPKEILQILVPAVREFLVESTKDQLVLKGARSNGMLAWRAIRGEFEQIAAANSPWIKEIGDMGGHRYPSSWLGHRFSWLGHDGVPPVPDWTEIMTMIR